MNNAFGFIYTNLFVSPIPSHSIMQVGFPSSCAIILNLTLAIISVMCMAVVVCNVNGNPHRNRLRPAASAINTISWSWKQIDRETSQSKKNQVNYSTWTYWSTHALAETASRISWAARLPDCWQVSLREPNADPPRVQPLLVVQPKLK